MVTVSEAFRSYREHFTMRPPDLTNQRFADEIRLITPEEGLSELTPAPASAPNVGVPPGLGTAESVNKYLWVIAADGVPIALESPARVELQRGRLCHTNLTGGASSYCGGELYFIDQTSVVVNGGSGRYPPRSAAELEEVAVSFKAAGYRTASMGWNQETNASYRTVRGELTWL